MLVTVDLAGFLFLMWKRPKEPPKEEVEEVNEQKVVSEIVVEKDVVSTPIKIEPELKASKILETEKEIRVTEEEGESKITIKKIEEVEEVEEVN